jgi:hypothetical protein
MIERLHPLLHAALDAIPVVGRQDPRDGIERQDAVDGVFLGVDSERDPEIVELELGVALALAQLLDGDAVQARA